MAHPSLHEYSVVISTFAAIVGIVLCVKSQPKDITESEDTDRMLLLMTFSYWLVYCVSFGLQHLISQEWDLVMTSVRLTGVLAYLLTFASVLSLPLHKVSVRQVE
jgi:hypothetical protein